MTAPAAAQSGVAQEAAAFVARTVAPHADDWDRAEAVPPDVLRTLGTAGWLGAAIGPDYGGRGLDALSLGLVAEQFGRGSVSLLSLLTAHGMACRAIARWGSPTLRRQWLPEFAAGTAIAAFAVSEPEIGSDAAGVRCTAARVAGGWRLDGRKSWISGVQIANAVVVLARTDHGSAAFLVDAKMAGVDVQPIRGMLGFRAAMLGTIEFADCRVPDDCLLARVGFGFSHVIGDALDLGRFCIAWGASGLLAAVVDATVTRAQEREQFGAALIKHQLIQRMIADMVTDRSAARLLCEAAAEARQARTPSALMATNTAKYFASRAAVRAASDAVQIHGAAGLGPDLPVQRYYRDAKAFELIEGSNEIQQMLIARDAQSHIARETRKIILSGEGVV